MNLPGVPPDFQLPDDPGERLAWMKNFATKLPKYAEGTEAKSACRAAGFMEAVPLEIL